MLSHRVVFYRSLFLSVLLFGFLGVPLVFGDSPEPRMGSGLVYDEVNGRCVLMGGAMDTGHGWSAFADMWVFDGVSGVWSELDVDGVPGRSNFQMAYSGDHEKIVALSNDDGDTWVYDVPGNRWSRLRIGGPRRRGDAGFCYDPLNRMFVLFGGMTDGDVSERFLNDTWVFDLDTNSWREMTPENSPPRCYGCRLVYDSVNEKLLLWGGNIPSIESKLDDWWSYDYPSNTWTRIETEDGPEGRYWHHMAFDPGVGKVVMFGGIPSGMSFGDTWLYDYALNQWTEVEPPVSPANRFCGAMVYDESIERVVLFGGLVDDQEEAGDTWLFDAEAGEWSIVEASAPTAEEEEEEEEDSFSEIPGFPAASIILAVLFFFAYARIRRIDGTRL